MSNVNERMPHALATAHGELIAALSAVAETKTCCVCFQSLPTDHFRRRRKGSEWRASECRQCHNGICRAYSARKKSQKVLDFARDVHRCEWSVNRLNFVLNQFSRNFGGLDRLLNAWKDTMDGAIAAGNHHVAGRLFIVIADLMLARQEQEPSPDTRQMSDFELAAGIKEQLKAMIQEEPVIVMQVAQTLGWTVIPP